MRLCVSFSRLSTHQRTTQPKWNSRGHFFVAAAEAMRRILIESIRRKQAIKRGGNLVRTTWNEAEYETAVPPENILAVHEALATLEPLSSP